jgi:hypothetical protein
MRSNGLTASAYTPIADLEPLVADALLADLRVQGVAAYTKPVESSATPGFDRPEFRVSVKDRLYVDTTASRRVCQLLALQSPDLDAANDDLTWAQIVATFDQPVAPGTAAWPPQEDIDTQPGRDTGPAATSPPATDISAGAPAGDVDVGRDTDSGRRDRRRSDRHPGSDPPKDADATEHFVPPAPPPLPRLDPHKQVAWLGLVGGPLLLVIAALFTVALPAWLSFLAVAGFVGGFVTLIATMDDRTDEDRDSDDGAVV